ncbi:transposase [Nostoc sp. CCY 9925]|uniref:transposase n=1 Tax=Nostoc sp. CCY 9925 TaxID=3103865 RepID=UPI0039C7008A
MPDILSLLQCLLPQINATTMRQLNQIIIAMLAMSGRVTMLGIARWTGESGSYRTMGRFFSTGEQRDFVRSAKKGAIAKNLFNCT